MKVAQNKFRLYQITCLRNKDPAVKVGTYRNIQARKFKSNYSTLDFLATIQAAAIAAAVALLACHSFKVFV
jgi:hypothetical protein